jgi:hypothetical protein
MLVVYIGLYRSLSFTSGKQLHRSNCCSQHASLHVCRSHALLLCVCRLVCGYCRATQLACRFLYAHAILQVPLPACIDTALSLFVCHVWTSIASTAHNLFIPTEGRWRSCVDDVACIQVEHIQVQHALNSTLCVCVMSVAVCTHRLDMLL